MTSKESIANELSLIVQNALALIHNDGVLRENRGAKHDILDSLSGNDEVLRENRGAKHDILDSLSGSRGSGNSIRNISSCTSSSSTTSYSSRSGTNSNNIHSIINENQYLYKGSKRAKLTSGDVDQFQAATVKPLNRNGGVRTSSNVLAYERRCVIRQLERILKEIDYQFEVEGEKEVVNCTDDCIISNLEQDRIVGNLVLIMTEILPHWLVSANTTAMVEDHAAFNSASALAGGTSHFSPLLQRVVNITHLSAKLIMHCIHPTTAFLVQPPSDHFMTPILTTIFSLCNKVHRNTQPFAFEGNRSLLSPPTPQGIQRESSLHLLTHLIIIINTSIMYKTSSSGAKLDDNEQIMLHSGNDTTEQGEHDLPVLLFPKLNSAQTIAFIVSLLHILLESNELFMFPCLSNAIENDGSDDSCINSLSKEVIHFQFSILLGDLFNQLLSITKVAQSSMHSEKEGRQLPTLLSLVMHGSKPMMELQYFACDDELIEDFVELTNAFVSQMLENSTDTIHILQTLWNRTSRINPTSRSSGFNLDLDGIEESFDKMLHQYQLAIQSIALSVNLLENVTPNHALLQIHIPQHLLYSFFHAFATLIASEACEDLMKMEGARQRQSKKEQGHFHPHLSNKCEGHDTESNFGEDSCCSSASGLLDGATSTDIEEIMSLKSMLVRLLKVVYLSTDGSYASSEIQIYNISLKRKALALKLSFLSTFDSHIVTGNLLEFMLKSAALCSEDLTLTETGLSICDVVSFYHAKIELYEANKLLQAALLSSSIMSSFTRSILHCASSTITSESDDSSQPFDDPRAKHMVNAMLNCTLNFNPWNSFMVRKLPGETAKKYFNSVRTCFNTLQEFTDK